MFLKPFKVKSHTQLKTSDKKKLRTFFSQHFVNIPEEVINDLIPIKDDVSSMKIFCHKGESVLVYLRGREPLAFSIESRIGTVVLPTLYLCWLLPEVSLAPGFHTSADVSTRLQQGADLMMPGVQYTGMLTQYTFGQFDAGAPALVITSGAVVAVGTAALSSTDLYMAGGHGKAVIVAHVLGDLLWEMGSKAMPPYAVVDGAAPSCNNASIGSTVTAVEPHAEPMPMPQYHNTSTALPSERCSSVLSDGTWCDTCSEDCSGSGDCSQVTPSSECAESLLARGIESATLQDCTPSQEQSSSQVLPTDSMDNLLLHCLLKAIQQSKGKLPLPILTSTFYAGHILPSCPDNAKIDIKKSSFKKVSKFLKAMEERGILKVAEHPKGVENIVQLNITHPDVTSFMYDKNETTIKDDSSDGSLPFVPPTMEEVHQVSGDTIVFFRSCGRNKGDVLTKKEVRDVVTEYIKRKKLMNTQTNLVALEPPLHNAVVSSKEGYVRELAWDQIFSRLLGRMAPAVRISRPGQPDIIKKGVLQPITMSVAKRAGNKKVTLVYNVSNFGIVETEFARQVQHLAAASTSVGPAENKPPGTTQILVQGNATAEIAKLLLETYNIPRKYIKGLELIPKNKKGKI